ncbi:MAG: SPOR domain-containing protein [Deltaproteobacteria bacterium]|nr:MAG: SPOR domain-containing protein [Deltaproteobacteria bacterium]
MARKIVKYQVDEKKYSDTREIFDSLFGKALRILFRRENLEDEAGKYEKKRRLKGKTPKSHKRDEAPEEARPEAKAKSSGAETAEAIKVVKSGTEEKSSGAETIETLKQDEPRRQGKPRSETEKVYKSPIKYERSEKANLKAIVKAKKSRRRKKMSKNQPKVGSNKRRMVLAFVLFLALAGAYFYYQSGGDLGKLTESLKSIKKDAIPLSKDIGKIIASLPSKIKGLIQPEAAKNVDKKPVKKPSQIARKPMPRSEIPPQPKEATPQKNLLIVKKAHTPVVEEPDRPAPPRQSYRRVVKETHKPVTKQPYSPVVQKPNKPAAEVSRPPAIKASAKGVANIQKQRNPESALDGRLPAEPPVSYPYSIHLGSYGSPERAKKAMSMYEKKGLVPYWVEVDLGAKGVWFRIFTGYFSNKEKAETYISEKQIADAKSKRTGYANLIGVYESQYELDRKRVTLSRLGYSPYVIPGVNGESLLYTGAFYQKDRAEKQHLQLASKGVRSRVVSR